MNVRLIDSVINKLERVSQKSDNRYSALCPAHDDGHPSLSVSLGIDGRVLIHCFTGCSTSEVLRVLKMEYRDLYL